MDGYRKYMAEEAEAEAEEEERGRCRRDADASAMKQVCMHDQEDTNVWNAVNGGD